DPSTPISGSTSVSSTIGLLLAQVKSDSKTEVKEGHTAPGPSSGAPSCSSNFSIKSMAKAEASDSTASPIGEIFERDRIAPLAEDTVFDVNKLNHYLRPLWNAINWTKDAVPFRLPADHDLPDIHCSLRYNMEIIYTKCNFDSHLYKNPWVLCEDMWLMFDNAWKYNRKGRAAYKSCMKLSEMFVIEMDPVMQHMAYCCSRRLSFTPQTLLCSSESMCTIARNQRYWVYEPTPQHDVAVSKHYAYCVKCFDALPPEGISLSDDPNNNSSVAPEDRFVLKSNDFVEYEPFEVCKYCHRKRHEICTLHHKKVYAGGLICNSGRKLKRYPKAENRFTARRLPHNNLSQFIEDRVNKFLRNALSNSPDQHEVIIRNFFTKDKDEEVKPLMRAKNFRTIFAFEVIDGIEVCFFGHYVQEYGSNCKEPIAR
ncbi:hypothetical protein Angca_002608, partial [Angiostrongylus cantonensis]